MARPSTRTELAGAHGVSLSAVIRALDRAGELHRADPERHPAPPQPLNPGARYPVYDPDVFARWWPTRPRPGRPPITITRPEI